MRLWCDRLISPFPLTLSLSLLPGILRLWLVNDLSFSTSPSLYQRHRGSRWTDIGSSAVVLASICPFKLAWLLTAGPAHRHFTFTAPLTKPTRHLLRAVSHQPVTAPFQVLRAKAIFFLLLGLAGVEGSQVVAREITTSGEDLPNHEITNDLPGTFIDTTTVGSRAI